MILAWSLVLLVAGPAEPAPATKELPAPAPHRAREADATAQSDERVAFVPNSDLRDPFAERRGSGRRVPQSAAKGPSRSSGLKDPFAQGVLRPPAKRRPPEARPKVPEGVLVDPFAARRGARHPPPRLSAELKDPFRAANARDAEAEARREAAPTRASSQPEACVASERDGVAIQRPEALRSEAPPCPSTPRSP
jgi:hypothetical protein